MRPIDSAAARREPPRADAEARNACASEAATSSDDGRGREAALDAVIAAILLALRARLDL